MQFKPENVITILVITTLAYLVILYFVLGSPRRLEMKLLFLGLLTALVAVLLGFVAGGPGVSVQVQPGAQAQAGWSLVGNGPVAALSKIAVLLVLGALGVSLWQNPSEPAAPPTPPAATGGTS